MTNERQAVFDKAIAGKIRDLAVAARSEYGSPEVRQALGLIADQLEAHARKYDPPIEEPTERWSVIFANVSGSRMVESKQLVRTDVGWLDGDGNGWGDFDSFSDVEVLRVGIGEPAPMTEEEINESQATAQKNLRREPIGTLHCIGGNLDHPSHTVLCPAHGGQS